MKFLTLILTILSGVAFAQNPLRLTDLQFSYTMPLGQGQDRHGTTLFVEKIWDDFHFQIRGALDSDFILSGAPAFILDAEAISVEALSFAHTSSNWLLNLDTANLVHPTEAFSVTRVQHRCSLGRSIDLPHRVISGCLDQLSLMVGDLQTSEQKLRDLELQVKAGSYALKALMKKPMGGKLTSKGSVSFDAANETLKIEIKEVKFGLINITGKVFKELEKIESNHVLVQKPFVFLKYDIATRELP